MQTLNIYAHNATEQQRNSMVGQGIPLNFIKDLETGVINIDEALINIKTHVAQDSVTPYHTADIHCALAAVHFVTAKRDGSNPDLLEEIRQDFWKEAKMYWALVDFREKTKLDENLRNLVLVPA